jgi:hypothetical protein
MVLDGIEELRGRLTMVLVTPRPERLGAADQALRLENGVLKVVVDATTSGVCGADY